MTTIIYVLTKPQQIGIKERIYQRKKKQAPAESIDFTADDNYTIQYIYELKTKTANALYSREPRIRLKTGRQPHFVPPPPPLKIPTITALDPDPA